MDIYMLLFGTPLTILFVVVFAFMLGAWVIVYLYCLWAGLYTADKLETMGWPFPLWVLGGLYVFLQFSLVWTFVSLKLAELMGLTTVPW